MTCRPEVLTRRWVNEISESIHNVCLKDSYPTPKRIVCTTNPGECWKEYYSSLEVDYNVYRNKDNEIILSTSRDVTPDSS